MKVNPYLSYLTNNMNFLPVYYYCQQKKNEKYEWIPFGAFIKKSAVKQYHQHFT